MLLGLQQGTQSQHGTDQDDDLWHHTEFELRLLSDPECWAKSCLDTGLCSFLQLYPCHDTSADPSRDSRVNSGIDTGHDPRIDPGTDTWLAACAEGRRRVHGARGPPAHETHADPQADA